MIWSVILEAENGIREWMGGPFYDLGVAVSNAITLADTLGKKTPLLLGRHIRVECDDELELSIAVISGGLNGGAGNHVRDGAQLDH
ncbi:MAG: hypothetical protein ACRYF2_24620 [Janthinobacterium lividum]